MKKYVADFETVNDEENCRVWAWGVLSIDETEEYYGEKIEQFINVCKNKLTGSRIYFHNLKFDGSFIIDYLLKNGYEWDKDKHEHTFYTLISDMNQFYEIEITFEQKGKTRKKVTFYDSLKIIPLKVEEIPKAFGLNIKKLEIDYNKNREEGYKITEYEKEYLKHDLIIVARALNYFFVRGLDGMTIGSIALKEFKKLMADDWQDLFPMNLELDSEIRQAYKGAFTYVKEGEEGKDQQEGLVFDVNSLYPSRMYECKMPYGTPIKFYGKYKKDDIFDYYFIIFSAVFDLKEGMLPTIQIKKNFRFIPTEYVKSSGGEVVTMCLTCTDFDLFCEQYNISYIEYHVGYKFKTRTDIFTKFVNKWINVKNKATIDKNAGMRTIAKLMLNNLYGKFATRPTGKSKIPYLENDVVKYKLGEEEERKPMFIPIGAAITAYAREYTIRAAQANYDRFLYADTDSLHLKGTEIPASIEIDDVKLGAWKLENRFTRARFLRAKSYIEEIDGNIKVTCAGLPDRCHSQVTFDNFYLGAEYGGKLAYKIVSGGTVLWETTFKIRS